MSGFVGWRVLVTGAASGIGLAPVRRFAAEGAQVLVTDRDVAAAEAVCAGLGDGGHIAAGLDVTEEQGWTDLAARIERAWGSLDVLVNNAGAAPFCPMTEMTLEAWRAARAVNLDSAFLGTRAMLPLLARSGRGAIVNISSIRGIVGGIDIGAYSAAKGALRLFTKATALECAALNNGVRANSIHPGLIATPLAAAAMADPTVAERRMATLPLGRAGEPDDIAAAILFAAGPDARYMTGAEIVVDGGTIAQ